MTMELQQTQEALTAALGERDELKIAYETAAAQITDMQTQTEGLKVAKVGVRVCDAAGNVVNEYNDLSELKLDELKEGDKVVIVLYNAAGEVISQYDVNSIAPVSAPAEAPAEETPAEEAPAA